MTPLELIFSMLLAWFIIWTLLRGFKDGGEA